ncbi:MAG: FlgO family outer membrane protein [Chthoniobacterales bacterium]
MRGFLRELKHRRVYRVALAYGVVASGLVQIGGTILPIFHAPEWVQQLFVVLIAVGFPFALVLAWAFDITSTGIQRTSSVTGLRVTSRRQVWVLALLGTALAGLFLSGYWFWHPWRVTAASGLTKREITEKSIAVLPFQNLSEQKANAFFADGVQDQILTDLAKVADLKVISHTSVDQYKGAAGRNLHEIGQQLGVAFVLQGSVQRSVDRLRVSAQLIDARTEQQLWADTYDGDLSDAFMIQSDIAKSIVAQLRARISPQEKAGIEERPTLDYVAFDLYLQAKELIDSYLDAPDPKVSFLQALRLLEEATARDPKFVLAYAYAARAHDLLYFLDLDPTPARVARAAEAAATALRLQPDSAEAHLSMAGHYFRALRDYKQAQKEIALARPGLPNSAAFFVLAGYIERRRGHWPEALQDFEAAVKIDPRNPNAVNLLADTYILLRRFSEAVQNYTRAIAAGLDSPIIHLRRESILFSATGDPEYIRRALALAPPDLDVGGGETALRIFLALVAHDYAAAEKALAASPREDFQEVDFSFYYPRAWYEAIIAGARGDRESAQKNFAAARQILEARLMKKPEDPRTLAVLALIDARLGEKDIALEEAGHAVALMPVSRDAYDGVLVLQGLAQVYAWSGETDQAFAVLQKLTKLPGYLSYGYLRVDPVWAPLRSDPRFEKLVARLAPQGSGS